MMDPGSARLRRLSGMTGRLIEGLKILAAEPLADILSLKQYALVARFQEVEGPLPRSLLSRSSREDLT
jgi:hypothetical protein